MQGAEYAGVAIVAVLVGVVVAVVLGLLIGALFLRWSVRILQGFSPGYGRSVLIVFVTMICGFALSVILAMILASAGIFDMSALSASPDPRMMASMMTAQLAISVANFVIGLLLTGLFVHLMIVQPDGSKIGFGRSVLVALLYMLMTFAFVFVMALILVLVVGLGAAGLAAGAG